MPPSQLKRLKASLREQGITGPQKSKKQKKNNSKTSADQHAKKAAALASIRESFNPFEFKHLARPKKFEYVTNQPQDAKTKVLGRPGVTKSQGEETRRKTLLPEMSKKNKVGGILDRRIGEDDPTMSLEDKMMARFEREQQSKRGGKTFDLEEDDDEFELTHGGKALEFNENDLGEEDYDAASVSGSSDDGEEGESGFLTKKRRRDSDNESETGGDAEDQPERKKSKAEVMKEVIAKSKLHKYERQQQKEDDDDLRDALDKDLNDVLAALRGHMHKKNSAPEPPKEEVKSDFSINPDRAAMLEGRSREDADREYDTRVRQMLFDQRSKPTERTKTEEEKAQEDAEKLRSLEEKRMRRMRGEPTSDDEDEAPRKQQGEQDDEDMESIHDDAAEFGLGAPEPHSRPEGVEDEDDFLLEDDLIASDSEADLASDDESDDEAEVDDTMAADEDDDFLKSVMPESDKKPPKAVNGVLSLVPETSSSKLAFTYACPRSHEELLKVFKGVAIADLPTAVQRVRALYHAGLHAENKEKLSDFACALVDHISYLSNQDSAVPLTVLNSIIRHVHSLSRAYPAAIATRFRVHLKALQLSNSPTPGDLMLLTAIGSIYPTSDHFHQVVTPAITLMARWLGLTTPTSQKDIATGAYLGALCLSYQTLAKRYIPELIRYTTLSLRSPHTTPSLLTAHTTNILTAATLWHTTPSFPEIFTPLLPHLLATSSTQTHTHLTILLHSARLTRRPQRLHNHRALPIKSSVPKFEESFDPTKHYDPDKDRAEAAKLRKEYKREKKGAMRELRKDANFIAREKLRDKKERDRAYVEKERRLIAEIQGEGARDRNEWEREKRRAKSKK
ncbi:Nop14-like protein [Periconia macrospinosa]|uniref:Nop14-like protein n=1 Tax=Periconia macrospinosa TaxID=97972 RepID=A0A2V1EBX4_9PLEO|nr:Nop14-like protein [Periconia macrospinosa]